MKNFLIITNTSKDNGLTLTNRIKLYIEEKGGSCQVQARNSTPGEINKLKTQDEIDCILVLGGDGTMIRAARDTVQNPIPMIGVNLGNLGYLCELDENTVFTAIDRILGGDYAIEERMMLSGQVFCGGEEFQSHSALNDIVIYRAGNLQVVSLNLYVNGKFLCNYFADGLIVATPTGSTAYSMSAGGPIVDPKAELIVLTPVNAQAMSAKSIVISSEDEITIEVMERNQGKDSVTVEIAFDGDNIAQLKAGEKIQIRKALEHTQVLKLSEMGFIERLQQKMSKYR